MKKMISILLITTVLFISCVDAFAANGADSSIDEQICISQFKKFLEENNQENFLDTTEVDILGMVNNYYVCKCNIGMATTLEKYVIVDDYVILCKSTPAYISDYLDIMFINEDEVLTFNQAYEKEIFSMHEVAKIIPNTCLIGDVNSDWEITIADTTAMQKYFAEYTDFVPDNIVYSKNEISVVGDFNKDREFNIKDATAIQKKLAEIAQ